MMASSPVLVKVGRRDDPRMETTSTPGSPTAGTSPAPAIAVTPLGGPSVLLDLGGVRLLVDPTFDPPGEYSIAERTLVKTHATAWTAEQVGAVAAVLLSHDQHPDNLDRGGRQFLETAPIVLTTAAAAQRLGGTARSLPAWTSTQLGRPGGRTLRITGVPAQHGPDGTEHLTGPVTGFVLCADDLPTVYVSGDNASLEIVRSIAARCGPVDVAVLFAGAAKTALLGDALLTLSSAMAVEAARILDCPRVLGVHTDGWAHFTENSDALRRAFADAGMDDAPIPAAPGETVNLIFDRRARPTRSTTT
jgi:L-ascorbate metabolism protein UlaG (beta-lactamase superfamily)